MLLYFCDDKDFEDGEFQVHDCSNSFNIIQKIKPEHNLAIISIQNNQAYHSVNQLKITKNHEMLYTLVYILRIMYGKKLMTNICQR